MSAKKNILCIGMPVRDLTFGVQAVPGRGQKFHADRFAQICGGNALNAAIGINRLGGQASLTGPMGDAAETSGQYIFDDLAKEGIDSAYTCLVVVRGKDAQADWAKQLAGAYGDAGVRKFVEDSFGGAVIAGA